MASRSKKNYLTDNYHLLAYDEVDSTNAEARRLAEGGAAHGAVIWAKRQSAGRGRMGRAWISEEGNLFVTFLLAPGCSLETLSEMPFVAALAVLDTLFSIVGETAEVRLKWPNDILLGGKKVGGVLIETFETAHGGKPCRWAAAGIGVNVEHHPAEVAYPATCLTEAGVEIISAKIVLSRLIFHFGQRYDAWKTNGFAPARAVWKKHAFRLGESIAVDTGEGKVSGVFSDLDPAGRLLLQVGDRETRIISAGDVLAS